MTQKKQQIKKPIVAKDPLRERLKRSRKRIRAEIESASKKKNILLSQITELERRAEFQQNELKQIQAKYLEQKAQLVRLFDRFKPGDTSIRFSSGTYYTASHYKLETNDWLFFLSQVNMILSQFKEAQQWPVLMMVNRALSVRLFGSVHRTVDYGDVKFAVSEGISDDTVIVVARHFAP